MVQAGCGGAYVVNATSAETAVLGPLAMVILQ